MKIVAFDLGDTLVEYEGLPPSWEQHYTEALLSLASFLRLSPSCEQLAQACLSLRSYNTRINPREKEVSFSQILSDVLPCLGIQIDTHEIELARPFFKIFRQRLRGFPDSQPTLIELREKGLRTSVFTDVPYGMPKELVLEDISETGLTGFLDAIVTSCDVGFRKPSPISLKYISDIFHCTASEMSYVGNEKKDIDAAKAFGCHAVFLDRGRHNIDWGQDRTIYSLTDLLKS